MFINWFKEHDKLIVENESFKELNLFLSIFKDNYSASFGNMVAYTLRNQIESTFVNDHKIPLTKIAILAFSLSKDILLKDKKLKNIVKGLLFLFQGILNEKYYLRSSFTEIINLTKKIRDLFEDMLQKKNKFVQIFDERILNVFNIFGDLFCNNPHVILRFACLDGNIYSKFFIDIGEKIDKMQEIIKKGKN